MAWKDHRARPAAGSPLCRLDEIPDGQGREFVFGQDDWPLRLFVIRRGTAAWAYVNACPHIRLTLNFLPDRFVSRDEPLILCSNHGARFRFEDGLCVDGPCAGDRLEAVPIRLRDGVVSIGD